MQFGGRGFVGRNGLIADASRIVGILLLGNKRIFSGGVDDVLLGKFCSADVVEVAVQFQLRNLFLRVVSLGRGF